MPATGWGCPVTTERGGGSPRRLLGPLGWRLLAAFAAVALLAVTLLAGLAVFAGRGEVSSLVAEQRSDRAQAVADAVAESYAAAGGWAGADLSAADALARSGHAQLVVTDISGAVVRGPGMGRGNGMRMRDAAGAEASVPVVVDGAVVGTATLRFPPGTADDTAATRASDAIVRNVGLAAALALVVAVLAAILATRFLTRPIVALSEAARAVGRDGPDRRPPMPEAPGELGELSRTLDEMATTLAREDAMRRGLVADVAHELRTPVTILQAATEEMADGLVDATPERLASLHEEILRLSRIVEDLGTLAAADAATLRMDRQPVDLADVAGECAVRLQDRFAEANLELELDVKPVIVQGDAARLGQVVTNLLINAVKFTPGGGRVTVSVSPEHDQAVLTVRDSGPGIPEDELPHVFERFWRGRQVPDAGGSGVGLAVVAEIVRAHGGTVSAQRPPGGGAEFTVHLPAEDEQRAGDGKPPRG